MTRDPSKIVNQEDGTERTSTESQANHVQQQVADTILDAIKRRRDTLVSSPPASGKSRGTFEAIRRSNVPAIYLSPRRDMYEQAQEWCDEEGLSSRILPALPRDCQTYPDNGIRPLHKRGARPKEIHERGFCGDDCPYLKKLPEIEEPENGLGYVPEAVADVLIGHPLHGKVLQFVNRRIAIYDDVSKEMYIDEHNDLDTKISSILSDSEFPFSSVEELFRKRDGEQVDDALEQLAEIEQDIWEDDRAYADGKRIVETVLQAEELDNGYRHHHRDGYWGVTDGSHNVYLLDSPYLWPAEVVITLDAYPMLFTDSDIPVWLMQRLSIDPAVVTPLDEEETKEYISDSFGLNVIQSTTNVKTYSSGEYVATQEDPKLIEYISMQHDGKEIPVITTAKAKPKLEDDELPVKSWLNFARVQSNNTFAKEDVGLVLGSTHYSNQYPKKIGAFMNQSLESNGEKSHGKSYGSIGNVIFREMREFQVAQAILRFGRAESVTETTVYVETAAIPEIIPVEEEHENLSSAEAQILRYLADDEVTTNTAKSTDIYPHVNHHPDHVRRKFRDMEDKGLLVCVKEGPRSVPNVWRLPSEEDSQ